MNKEQNNKAEKQIIKISDIVSFLYDPLQYHANRLFGKDYERKTEKETFEPLEFDHITSAAIKKIILKKAVEALNKKAINKKAAKLEEVKLEDNFFESLNLSDIVELKKYHTIDEPFWTDAVKKIIKDGVKSIFDNIKHKFGKETGIETEGNIMNLVMGNYLIEGECSWYNKDWQKSIELKAYSPSSTKKYLNSYVTALCLIAKKGKEGTNYNLLLCYGDAKNIRGENPKLVLTKLDSVVILENIINAMVGSEFYKCIPYDIVDDFKEINKMDSLSKLYGKIKGLHGSWSYFDYKNMFTQEELGYGESGFEIEWQNELTRYCNFFPKDYFNVSENTNQSNNAKTNQGGKE